MTNRGPQLDITLTNPFDGSDEQLLQVWANYSDLAIEGAIQEAERTLAQRRRVLELRRMRRAA